MDICNNGHDEIVHSEGWRRCPLCAAIERNEELAAEINELNTTVEALRDELYWLNLDGSSDKQESGYIKTNKSCRIEDMDL